MRMLFLGAGGTGGYFGGRAAQAGADVTFLVREKRAQALRAEGLRIESPLGDAVVHPKIVTQSELKEDYDLVVLSCKAYDLDAAIEAIAPAVGEDTTILPIMNGVAHYEVLDTRFGAHRVLGGLCQISATLGEGGVVRHLNKGAAMTFGERTGDHNSARSQAIVAALGQAGFDLTNSANIYQAIWEKFTFLTSLAAATCLMRGTVGEIASTQDGLDILRGLIAETQAVATAMTHPVSAEADARTSKMMLDPNSPMTASMFRDLQGGQQVEADHIVGDMAARARTLGIETPYLRTAYCHLQVYQNRRAKQADAPGKAA